MAVLVTLSGIGCDGRETGAGSSSTSAAPCFGGCLCYQTAADCPAGCEFASGHCLEPSPPKNPTADASDGGAPDAGDDACPSNVPCNCVYSPADGGTYVCDGFSMPACPSGATAGSSCLGFPGSACMGCDGVAGYECQCSDAGRSALVESDSGYSWGLCIGTGYGCKGP